MPTNDQDARALTYIARRLRHETNGANDWDEPGIYKFVSALVGQQLAHVVERVTRHAADPSAKTPGAINRPFLPAAAERPTPTPPRADPEQIARDKAAAVPPPPEFQAARDALRSKL